MTCIEVDYFIEMHDKPHTFLTVVDKTSVHRQVFYGVAICARSFEFTTGEHVVLEIVVEIDGGIHLRHSQKFKVTNVFTLSFVSVQKETLDGYEKRSVYGGVQLS